MQQWLATISIKHAPNFTSFISHFGYMGILVWFLTFDQLTPLPEELSLLTIGYLVSLGVFNPFLAGIMSLAGFLVIDTIYFFLSKKGVSLFKGKVKKEHSFRAYVTEHLNKNIVKTIIIICYIPRMRLWGPVIAGSSKISYGKFILADIAGLAPFTALYIALGYFFHQSLGKVFSKVKTTQTIIFFGAIVVIGIIVILISRKFFMDKKEREAAKG